MDSEAERLRWKLETLDELIEQAEQETPQREVTLTAMRRVREETEEKLRKLAP